MFASDISMNVLFLIDIANSLEDIFQNFLHFLRRQFPLFLNISAEFDIILLLNQESIIVLQEYLLKINDMSLFL